MIERGIGWDGEGGVACLGDLGGQERRVVYTGVGKFTHPSPPAGISADVFWGEMGGWIVKM
jgi:hypothetical protein